MLPKSMAQLTGVIVCSIVVFGTDLDVTYAVPLGVLSGALAVFFVAVAEARELVESDSRISRRRAGSN
jgi:hypothetical protein